MGCGGCTATWTGFKMAHCGQCHRTFSVVGNFDRHRSNGRCVDPETIGMVLNAHGSAYLFQTPEWSEYLKFKTF